MDDENKKIENRLRLLGGILLGILVICMLTTNVSAAKYKNKWVKKSTNITYYYNAKGKKITGLAKIKSDTYYFDKSGILQHGWYKINGKYRYFRFTNGKMLVNKTIDTIKIDKKGAAKITEKNKAHLQNLVQAGKILRTITKPGMTKIEKLKKSFIWVIKFPYINLKLPDYTSSYWFVRFGKAILSGHGGPCYSDAAAFGYLARAIGYDAGYVCSSEGHGWTQIKIGNKEYIFDPLCAEEEVRKGRTYSYFSHSLYWMGNSALRKKYAIHHNLI